MENNFLQQILNPVYQAQFEYYSYFTQESIKESTDELNPPPKVRGRKKIRPGNPLKTEVLDKYWLRAFKNFIKMQHIEVKSISNDPEFWSWYLTSGKPGKNTSYLSYNSKYKKKLFENSSFSGLFAAWALIFGSLRLPKKILKASWEFYYQYLYQELLPKCYNTTNYEDIKFYYSFIQFKVCKELEVACNYNN
jgi:hypothetical protein